MTDSTKSPKKKPLMIAIVSVVVFVVFVFVGALASRFIFTTFINKKADAPTVSTKQQKVEQIVDGVKRTTTLPKKIDDVTVWTEIKAGQGAVLYDYELVNVAAGDFDQAALESHLVQMLCSTADTRAILDSDISMSYRYTVQNDGATFVYIISKSDCAAA